MKNNTQPQIRFGFVTQYTHERGFGIAIVENYYGTGQPKSLSLSHRNGPFSIEAGEVRPYLPHLNGSRVSGLPSIDDFVVMEVVEKDGIPRVLRWGLGKDWEAAKVKIVNMEKSRPVRSYQFMKKFTGAVMGHISKSVAPAKRTERRPLSTTIFNNTCRA